jgi:hypothetical protein
MVDLRSLFQKKKKRCQCRSGDRGKVLLAAWQMLKTCSSPEEAEAEAYLWVVRLSAECSYAPFDRRRKIVQHGKGILKEIRAACMLLPEYKFQYIRRTTNKVAHTLAQHAMHTKEFVVKRLETPTLRALGSLLA